MTNIETPDGWERRGPCFIREHGGKLAVIDPHPEKHEWWWVVYSAGEDSEDANRFVSLTEAIHLANEQLGVPKPVEVVEIECEDGVLLYSEDRKRWAIVFMSGAGWWVQSKHGSSAPYPSKEAACVYARAYVRGDA